MVTLRNLLRDESGQSMVEYGILAAVIAAVCIGAFKTLGQKINTTVGTLTNEMGN